MTVLDDAGRIARLGLVLELREATIAPVLAAATIARAADILVGASAHGRRLTVVLPYHPDVLAAIAPGARAQEGPSLLRIQIDGEALTVAAVTTGGLSPRAAVDALAAPAVREPWFDLVDQLTSIADARVVARAQWLDGGRAQLEIGYPARDRPTDQMLMLGIDQLAEDLGITAAQRRLWLRIHPDLGRGQQISVSTACTAGAVSPHLGIAYPIDRWETALRIGQGLVLNDSEAKQVPSSLGSLAGALAADRPESLELVLGPHEPPDVIVWARVAPGS